MASFALSNTTPDEDLVHLCRQGEHDAFAVLYGRYRRRVLVTAHRIIRDPEEARDATQEIFLKAFLSLQQWNAAKSKLSTWLYRLAQNHAIDCWRAQKRRSRCETASAARDGVTAAEPSSGASSGPEMELIERERAAEFRRLVDTLPKLQKRFFILRHYHGLNLLEIAEIEKRSLGTVKGSLHRATQFLTRRLRHSVVNQNSLQCGRSSIYT